MFVPLFASTAGAAVALLASLYELLSIHLLCSVYSDAEKWETPIWGQATGDIAKVLGNLEITSNPAFSYIRLVEYLYWLL